MKKFLLLLLVLTSIVGYSQKERLSIGLGHGNGWQYTCADYNHDNHFYKGYVYFTPKQKGNSIQYQLAVEPEINFAKHKNANSLIQSRQVIEYSLGMGVIGRHYFGGDDKYSIFAIVTTGPSILDRDTDRLAKGFAMTSTFGIGTSYRSEDIRLELRPSLRHVSNLGIASPNGGLNTVNVEVGIFMPICK